MKSSSMFSTGAAIAASLAVIAYTTPAGAQQTPEERARRAANVRSQVEFGGRTMRLQAAERNAIAVLDAAARGTDVAAQAAALAAATAAARSDDARWIIQMYQVRLAQQRQDQAMLAAALDAAIANPLTPPDTAANFVSARAGLALVGRDYAAARAGYTRLLDFRPNDPTALYNLAQIEIIQNNNAAALPLLERAIAGQRAAGQAVPEAWYRQAMVAAYTARQLPSTVAAARQFLQAYPTAENWRTALVAYRQLATLDDDTRLDLLRLMRAGGAMSDASEYMVLAQSLTRAGLATEAQTVFQEGTTRGLITASTPLTRETSAAMTQVLVQERAALATGVRTAATAPNGTVALRTAESLMGAGRHGEAIPLLRTALQKGGVDANLVNFRLGMALAAAGQRAEAETAFRSVRGPRADLAGFWLDRLAQPR